MSTKRVLAIITFVWMCAAVITFPPVIAHRFGYIQVCRGPQCFNCKSLFDIYPAYTVFASSSSFFLPLLVVVFTNYRTYTIVQRNMFARSARLSGNTCRLNSARSPAGYRRRTIATSPAVHLQPTVGGNVAVPSIQFVQTPITGRNSASLRFTRAQSKRDCFAQYREQQTRCCNAATVLFCGCICWRRLMRPPTTPLVCHNVRLATLTASDLYADSDPSDVSEHYHHRHDHKSTSNHERLKAQKAAAQLLNRSALRDRRGSSSSSSSDSDSALVWPEVQLQRMRLCNCDDARNNNECPDTCRRASPSTQIFTDGSMCGGIDTLIGSAPVALLLTNQRRSSADGSITGGSSAAVLERPNSRLNGRPSSFATTTTTGSLGQLSRSSRSSCGRSRLHNPIHSTPQHHHLHVDLPGHEGVAGNVRLSLAPLNELRRLSAPNVRRSSLENSSLPVDLPNTLPRDAVRNASVNKAGAKSLCLTGRTTRNSSDRKSAIRGRTSGKSAGSGKASRISGVRSTRFLWCKPRALLRLLCCGAAVHEPYTSSTPTVVTRGSANSADADSRRFGNGARREYKATRTLLSITCVFIVCWLPYYVCFTLESFCPGCFDRWNLTSHLLWLGWCNSGINPIIYMCLSKKIRYAIIKTFLCGRSPGERVLATARRV
jgi:hypothetical protein